MTPDQEANIARIRRLMEKAFREGFMAGRAGGTVRLDAEQTCVALWREYWEGLLLGGRDIDTMAVMDLKRVIE